MSDNPTPTGKESLRAKLERTNEVVERTNEVLERELEKVSQVIFKSGWSSHSI